MKGKFILAGSLMVIILVIFSTIFVYTIIEGDDDDEDGLDDDQENEKCSYFMIFELSRSIGYFNDSVMITFDNCSHELSIEENRIDHFVVELNDEYPFSICVPMQNSSHSRFLNGTIITSQDLNMTFDCIDQSSFKVQVHSDVDEGQFRYEIRIFDDKDNVSSITLLKVMLEGIIPPNDR